MYRANDRHSVDDRILVIKNMKDFRLWRERAQLGIHGMMWQCDVPTTNLEKEAALISAEIGEKRKRMEESGTPSFPTITANCVRNTGILRKYSNRFSFNVASDSGGNSLSTSNGEVANRLLKILAMIAHESTHTIRYILKQNTDDRRTVEAHRPTLTFDYQSGGTVAYSGDYDDLGDQYQAAAGQFFVFDTEVWHESPQPDETWEEKPRILLACDLGPLG